MDNKYKYYEALKIDNGNLDEIDLGEKTGLDEDTTRRIISMLLSEHKIEYISNGACNYRIKTKKQTIKLR
jgi:hypothetical protein